MKWQGTIVLIGEEDWSRYGPFNVRTGKKTKLAKAFGKYTIYLGEATEIVEAETRNDAISKLREIFPLECMRIKKVAPL